MRISTLLRIASLGLLLLGGCQSVSEAFKTKLGVGETMVSGSAGEKSGARSAAVQLPQCGKSFGKLALAEGANIQSLAQYGLASPIPLAKLMAKQSRCFVVVNRGVAFDILQKEQSLRNVGKKNKIVPADYILTVSIISKNQNAGGVGGGVGAFLPGVLGLIAGGLRTNDVEASIQMALTRVDDGVEMVIATGSASKSDLSWFGFGAGFGLPVAAGLGGYTNTEVGKIVAAAMLDGYTKMVNVFQSEVALSERN